MGFFLYTVGYWRLLKVWWAELTVTYWPQPTGSRSLTDLVSFPPGSWKAGSHPDKQEWPKTMNNSFVKKSHIVKHTTQLAWYCIHDYPVWFMSNKNAGTVFFCAQCPKLVFCFTICRKKTLCRFPAMTDIYHKLSHQKDLKQRTIFSSCFFQMNWNMKITVAHILNISSMKRKHQVNCCTRKLICALDSCTICW